MENSPFENGLMFLATMPSFDECRGSIGFFPTRELVPHPNSNLLASFQGTQIAF
jgi:hypothetical protein